MLQALAWFRLSMGIATAYDCVQTRRLPLCWSRPWHWAWRGARSPWWPPFQHLQRSVRIAH
eukprot:1879863-Prorocentrum_lima.AAC.1